MDEETITSWINQGNSLNINNVRQRYFRIPRSVGWRPMGTCPPGRRARTQTDGFCSFARIASKITWVVNV